MKHFENKDKKIFSELSDEEMICIIREKMKMNAEIEMVDTWNIADSGNINFNCVYRTKPQKKLNIPWNVINKKYKYAAMDKSGTVFLYEKQPLINLDCEIYLPEKEDNFKNTSNILELDTSGIDWKESLTERPEE